MRWFIPGVLDDPRHGELLPHDLARLLSSPDVTVRLARLDPDASIVQDPRTYRPSASVRRRVRARDGHCRFPGCHTPARSCDLDHVIAFPHGPTDPANLIALCRTHHGFKHHGGWTTTLHTDGTLQWRAPDGRTWTTEPTPHAIRTSLHLTAGTSPDLAFHLRRGWQPGLPPGQTVADLAAAERRTPPDPPESPTTPSPPPDWAALDDPGHWPTNDQPRPPHPPGSPLEAWYATHLTLAA